MESIPPPIRWGQNREGNGWNNWSNDRIEFCKRIMKGHYMERRKRRIDFIIVNSDSVCDWKLGTNKLL